MLLKTKLQILPLVWEIPKPGTTWRLQRESYYAVLSLLLCSSCESSEQQLPEIGCKDGRIMYLTEVVVLL